jgi:hypothetical protein
MVRPILHDIAYNITIHHEKERCSPTIKYGINPPAYGGEISTFQ